MQKKCMNHKRPTSTPSGRALSLRSWTILVLHIDSSSNNLHQKCMAFDRKTARFIFHMEECFVNAPFNGFHLQKCFLRHLYEAICQQFKWRCFCYSINVIGYFIWWCSFSLSGRGSVNRHQTYDSHLSECVCLSVLSGKLSLCMSATYLHVIIL